MLDIEQEPQARGKAVMQVEDLRTQVSAVETRESRAALAQSESIAKREARFGAAVSGEQSLRQCAQSLEQELGMPS